MRDGNHNLKISLKTLSGFEYKPEVKNKSGSKLTVMDDNGNILHEGEFKSFTANFMRLLYGNMCGSGTVTATDLNGDSSAIDGYPNVKMHFAGGSGKQKFGIGVGSGSTAVSNADNNLTWVAGLTYNNVVLGTPAIDGSTVRLDITREISNSSGSTKTLYEAGLICGAEDDVEDNILIARDLVSVELLNGKKSTWRYTITVDFDSTTGGFVRNFLDSLIIQWTRATASASFSKRRVHTSVVFDNKMWVIGGYNGSSNLNDVWYSSDGATWTQATASASFSGRSIHTSVVFDNKMWVIGGYDTANLNDVWYSSDGATWTLATPSASFYTRAYHTSAVFDNKMWVIGGYNGSYLNDVWYYGKQLDASALITDDTRGILVGSSDASFDETDTALKTKIEHGTGAGQLEYGVMPYTTDTVEPFIDGDKTLMTLARRFENNSGGSVTIKEVGIMSVNGLLCRIIPATPIVVENGASEIITITFESEV